MAVLTGADGKLLYQSKVCGKTRDWSLNLTKDALEVTCLASDDRSYVEGLRGASGSATLLYDYDETDSRSLMEAILKNGQSDTVTFVFNKGRSTNHQFACNAIITSVSQSVSTGAVQAVSINFTVSGKVDGAY